MPDALPPRVADAATQRGLGQLVYARKGTGSLGYFFFFLAVTVGLVAVAGAIFGLIYLANESDTSLAAIAIVCLLGAVVTAIYAVMGLFRGSTAHYIFERGLVQTRRGRPDVITWADLDEIRQIWGSGLTAGKMLLVQVVTFDGRIWAVETFPCGEAGATEMPDRLADIAGRLGRPVLRRPRLDPKEPELVGVAEPPSKILVFGLLIGTAVLGFVIHAIGVPGWLAATLSFWLVGVVTRLAGNRYGRVIRALGWLWVVIGAFTFLGVVNDLLPINGWVATGIGVLFEIAAFRVLRRALIGALPMLGARTRRGFAKANGWQWVGEAPVALPGPYTAAHLQNVPAGVPTAPGHAVIRSVVSGMPVMIFDRIRVKPGLTDRPQTAWFVQLPAASPLHVPGMATSPIVTPDALAVAATKGFPQQWWIEGDMLCAARDGDDRTGTDPRFLPYYTQHLAAFAARLNWSALHHSPVAS